MATQILRYASGTITDHKNPVDYVLYRSHDGIHFSIQRKGDDVSFTQGPYKDRQSAAKAMVALAHQLGKVHDG